MSPAVASALADLDFRQRAEDAMRKALEAGDVVGVQRAYDALPSWVWPATVPPAVRELRELSRVTADPLPSRDYVGPGWPDGGAR